MLKKLFKSVRKGILSRMSPGKAALLEYWVPPIKFPPMDYAPFNSQRRRQQLFCELVRRFHFSAVVETGTYRGGTTRFLATESGVDVYTVELSERYYYFAQRRLRNYPRVRMVRGDTREFLARLARAPDFPQRNVFFYLDAHWTPGDLPLRAEVELIAQHWESAVIMIDDFQVPGDTGYKYDSRAGSKLCLDYLGRLEPLGLVPFFPSVPSARETGARRGCVVLALGQETARELAEMEMLRGKVGKMNEDSLR